MTMWWLDIHWVEQITKYTYAICGVAYAAVYVCMYTGGINTTQMEVLQLHTSVAMQLQAYYVVKLCIQKHVVKFQQNVLQLV